MVMPNNNKRGNERTIKNQNIKQMKNIYNISIALFLLFAFISCEEKEKITYDPDNTTISDLTIPGSVTLTMDNEDDVVAFSWTEADYGIAVSITYVFQVAASSDFSDPVVLYEGSELAFSTTVKDLNTKLLNNLGLEAETESTVYYRVFSTINSNVDALTSSVESIALTPYTTVFPPIYMIGGATGGWDVGLAVEVISSAPNVYSTIAYFIGNETFRFFAQQDWGPTSYNYPYFTGTVSDLFEDAMDGDNNFKFLGTSGYYRITTDLKNLTVDIESVPEPVMYMTGEAIGGWDQPGTGASLKMTFVKENVWVDTATFITDKAFRFFAQADWSPTSYNYPYFSDGTVDALFEDAGDGDNNFKFIGTTGSYEVTLNLTELTVTLVSQ